MIGRLGRILWTAAGFVGVLSLLGWPGTTPSANAQNLDYRSPNAVPAAWTRYAQLVQYRFKEWLAADDEVAYRFHLFLENRAVGEDTPPAALVVKVWIAKDGAVQRVEFPSLQNQQADADLRAILTQGNIGEPPPADLLQPLHLKLALQM